METRRHDAANSAATMSVTAGMLGEGGQQEEQCITGYSPDGAKYGGVAERERSYPQLILHLLR